MQELNLPLEAWLIPNWAKQIARFTQKGTGQFCLCVAAGLLAFPVALVGLLALLLWRQLARLWRR